MRKSLTILLLLAALASAMTLRKGASLGYRGVHALDHGDSNSVTLTVMDSLATDSGTLWKIAIRDSLFPRDSIRIDTAILRTNGSDTVWQKYSCLAPWDPASHKINDLTYGYVSLVCSVPKGYGYPIGAYAAGSDSRRYTQVMDYMADLPQAFYAPDTGLVRFNDVSGSWQLAQKDGHPISKGQAWRVGAKPIVPLGVGKQWIWSVNDVLSEPGAIYSTTNTTGTGALKWIVSDTLADSLGWMRRTIQSRQFRSWTRVGRAAGTVMTTKGVDSIVARTLNLRVQWTTGTTRLGNSDEDFLAAGFLQYWWENDHRSNESWTRYENSGSTAMGAIRSYKTIQVGVGPVTASIQHPAAFASSYADSRGIVYQLDPKADTTRSIVVEVGVMRRRGSGIASLGSLLNRIRTEPTMELAITDASGRTVRRRGIQAIVELRSRRGWVSIRLEDRSTFSTVLITGAEF